MIERVEQFGHGRSRPGPLRRGFRLRHLELYATVQHRLEFRFLSSQAIAAPLIRTSGYCERAPTAANAALTSVKRSKQLWLTKALFRTSGAGFPLACPESLQAPRKELGQRELREHGGRLVGGAQGRLNRQNLT